jgi:murein DD-endopeptidase MepM/ murein hydrolase activator NlpD
MVGLALLGWVLATRVAPFGSTAARQADSLAALEARMRRDTLRAGETLDVLLRRGGVALAELQAAIASATMLDPRRLRAGLAAEFVSDTAGGVATAVTLKLDVDHHVRIERDSAATWMAREVTLPWTTDTVVVRGAVARNLYDALGAESEALFPGRSHDGLVFAVADVYKFRVDMTRELQPGDSVHAVVERSRGPESTTRTGRVLASRLFVAGRPIEAFHFAVPTSSNAYYDAAGKSLATAFLRSPIEFARVTSGFGMRFHPILRIRRRHEGVDYGAAQGTPVESIGDGTVVRANNTGDGYGNVVEVRHPNGYVSRYAHLSRFAASARRGSRVAQGQVIGYVGATGLATAPHLHFEILVGGNQRSPTLALRNVDGTPLPASATGAFGLARKSLLALLDRVPGVVRPASAQ